MMAMEKHYAYSILEVKSVDEEKRVIRGVASTPTPDRSGDVVDPEGAQFSLPIPFLWQHNPYKPIGWVTEAKVTKKGISIVAEIAKGVTEDIEEAWAMIKSKLVRGLSIGFRGLDIEQIPNSWGVVFQKWEWLELSAVTIPANSEASILSVKKFDVGRPAASGIKVKSIGAPGVTGRTPTPLRPKEGEMKNIQEEIASFEATKVSKAAKLETLLLEESPGETLDPAKEQEAQTLEDEIASIENHLKRLKRLEAIKAATARPISGVEGVKDGSAARDTQPTRAEVIVRNPDKLDKGIGFARFVKCLGLAQGNLMHAQLIATQRYKNDDRLNMVLKTAVAAGATVSGNWAENLVGDETSLFADFVEFLRPQTILGKFGNNGVPALRNVPFRVPLISQTAGGNGYWVGEGKPKPLTKFNFSRTHLEPLKVANIAVVTKELLASASPSADTLIRDALAAALRERLDIDFIDPAKAASSGVSPASITNGVSAIASTGNDADAIREDVRQLMATFVAADNPPTSGVWIMSSATALGLSLLQNPLGQSEFPGINMNGGTFMGMPAIVSEYVPSVTAGGYIILVNAQDIYLADDGGITIDMSREASLQMNDAPSSHDSVTPSEAASLVSLWQTNSVGFLAERVINWAKRRSSAVAVLDEVAWGQPTS
jgi:HK97 family phage major capsid protein/HK97 family phage prohead protease